jgi:hypothetical protein
MKYALALLFLAPAALACPEGWRQTTNGSGENFCLFENITVPSSGNPRPYCEYLADGYIGFVYDFAWADRNYQCPVGMSTRPNDQGQVYCVLDGLLPLPKGARPYCDYLADGYIGYYWKP